jgi:ribosomal protein S18 acetylase RimI-like enzyme
MSIEVKILGPGDDDILAHVADDVFDNPVDPALASEFLTDPRHHIAVAMDDGLVVAFASGVHYIHPDKPAEMFVNEAAVAPHYQRRGLGKAVMNALLEEARAHGCEVAWVLTDRSNPAAMALYKSVGGEEGGGTGEEEEEIVGYSFDLAGD